LVKPLNEERLAQCVKKIASRVSQGEVAAKSSFLNVCSPSDRTLKSSHVNNNYSDTLVIDDDTTLAVKNIEWVDAAGDYMCIHSLGKTYILRSTLSHLQSQLDPSQFARIHRSTLINKAHIDNVKPLTKGDKQVLLINGTRLRSSRNYAVNLQ